MFIKIAISVICAVIFGALVYSNIYNATDAELNNLAVKYIASAASLHITGAEKMAKVVSQLLEYVPKPFKKIFTAETVENIAQKLYDGMKEFAEEDTKSSEVAK